MGAYWWKQAETELKKELETANDDVGRNWNERENAIVEENAPLHNKKKLINKYRGKMTLQNLQWLPELADESLMRK